MNTPPDSSIAKLFAIVSPCGSRMERTTLPGVTYPTTPETVTNQIRPAQSGSALWIPDPPVALLTSTSRTSLNPSPFCTVLRDHQQVPGEGCDDGAVLVVEVEVAAAREVAERERAGLARRQLVGGEGRQCLRVEHPQRRADGGDADRDDPALAVERHRGALGGEHRAGDLGVATERTGHVVGVGLVGVVVDVAALVGGHERVAGDLLSAVRLGRGGAAGERLHHPVAWVGGDRNRWGRDSAGAAAVSTPLSARRAASANAVRRKAVSMASPTTHPAWGNGPITG